jgi:hypothetical protein
LGASITSNIERSGCSVFEKLLFLINGQEKNVADTYNNKLHSFAWPNTLERKLISRIIKKEYGIVDVID